MKLTSCLRLIVAVAAFHVSSFYGADTSCDCTIFPFQPNPPCVDVCIPQHMAIAVEADLKNVFGLPEPVAATVSNIFPNDRPRRLKEYDFLILGYAIAKDSHYRLEPAAAYKEFEMKVHSLVAKDFVQVRQHAALAGWTLDGLKW